jgi:hypothetical protein
LNKNVKMVNVPRLAELSVTKLLADVANDSQLQMYLPDLKDSEGQIKYNISRQYLFNVINTVKPDFFQKNIRGLLEAKKDLHAE